MAPRDVSLALLLFAVVLFVVASYASRARLILSSIAFFLLVTEGLAFFSNWAPPQARVEPPPHLALLRQLSAEALTTTELAYLGELIIFGEVGTLHGQGKGQCPLCHGFRPEDFPEYAPNLAGITRRAVGRVMEPRYVNPDTIQTEAFLGSGRARNADEYIAESQICPHCYVPEEYGIKGSNDRESSMPAVHLRPIRLTVDEMIAVHTWLYVHDGEPPPSPARIRGAYLRLLPQGWRPDEDQSSDPGQFVGSGEESPEHMLSVLGCGACHTVPKTANRFGVLGPVLISKTTAPERIASAQYQARVRAGAAQAKTPKEYVIESIMDPNAYIVPAFVNAGSPDVSMMPDYSDKLTPDAVDRLADFLLSIDQSAAARDGIVVDREWKKGL